MTATIFGYVVLFTLLLAGAAAAIEWGMQGRIGARHVWTVAIALALIAPGAAVTWHTLSTLSAPLAASTPGVTRLASDASAISVTGVHAAQTGMLRTILNSASAAWSGASAAFAARAGWSARAAQIALTVWAILSLALAGWLVIGVLRWRAARVAWEPITLDGIDVDVSPSTGPAVLGFLSHRIVLPEWATRMEPERRRLILAHEGEHISARDPQRLALAIAAIILMPWNIGLWLCAARLRRAVELDCDARVLRRFPGAKEYGYVLLEVAARGRGTGPLALPMVALLRLPSELEQRLKAMTRTRTLGYRGAIVGGLAAIAAVSVAFAAPIPLAQVPEDHLPAPTDARPPASVVMTNSRLALDTVPRGSGTSQRLTPHQRDSLLVLDREMAARRIAVQRAQARVEAAQVELNKRRLELNAERSQAEALAPHVAANSNQTYFDYQVEKAAVTRSGAPVYPTSLRTAGIGGEVDAEFIVDTLGRVDPGVAIKITKATNALLGTAVLSALPTMRFYPAEIGGRKVRQLVRQPFTFTTVKNPR